MSPKKTPASGTEARRAAPSRVVTSLPGLAVTLLIIGIFCLSALQAGLVIMEDERHLESRYLIMSLVSMGVSGLGLIGLLLGSQLMLERAVGQKGRALALLEPRTMAMEAAMDGIAMVDGSGAIAYVNKMLAQFYACAKDDLTGKRWTALYSPAQSDFLTEEIFPRLEKDGHWSGHTIGQRPDGSSFLQDISITRLRDGGLIFIIRDFTEEKKTQDLSARRLAAMEAAGDGIGIVDAEGRLTYMNGALMRLHGLSRRDLPDYIGQHWANLYTDKGRDEIINSVMPLVRREGRWKGEAPVVRKDGTVTHAEMTLTLLPDGGMIGTARDITDRRTAQAERENLEKQFFQAQKMEAVGRLAGGIAHDFNNILASVMGYAGFLIEDLPDKSEAKSFARQIMQGCQQARNLVEQILTFSRRREDVRETMDLNAALQDTVNMLRSTLPALIELRNEMPEESVLIRANPVQIGQELMNLCVNARDAMPEERGILSISLETVTAGTEASVLPLSEALREIGAAPEIRIMGETDGATVLTLGNLMRSHPYARLTITDDGCGISHNVMEHMFEPFFTTKPMDLGTGLGLSAVHGIVASHQGALLVRSLEGRGTTFSLYFPVTVAERVMQGQETGLSPLRGSGHILLVEDQSHVQAMLKIMLNRMGYDTSFCNAGDEAVDHLRENPGRYDLVLSDQSMPRMSGVEMAAHIHEDFPDLPIILITGYSHEHLMASMEKNPSIRAVLPKPVDAHVLARHLKDILGKARAA